MKNLALALAFVGCIAACKSEKTSISDPASPNAPKSDCCTEKSGACAEKAGTCTEKAEACPMTKKPQG